MARAQVVRRSRLRLPGSVAAAETEAVRLTARLTALCIQQLLLLARFLLGCAGDAAAAHEGFEWPEAPAGKAALLRTQVCRIHNLHDSMQVCSWENMVCYNIRPPPKQAACGYDNWRGLQPMLLLGSM